MPIKRTMLYIEDLLLAVLRQSVLQRLDAERRLHRDRQAPRQYTPEEPVQHDSENHQQPHPTRPSVGLHA